MRRNARTAGKKASVIFLSFLLVLTSVSSAMPFLVSSVVSAAGITDHVVINEILPAPINDENEWVELYNPTDESVDISDWMIMRGNDNELLPYPVASLSVPSVTIQPKGFVVVEILSPIGNYFDDNTGTVRLVENGTEIDKIEYTGVTPGNSFSRKYDASDEFSTSTSPTKNYTNGPVPVEPLPPSATIFSSLIETVQAGSATPFQLKIDKTDDSGPANIRIEMELRQDGPVQPASAKFEYAQSTENKELSHNGTSYVYGPESGFEMIDASYDFIGTFNVAGNYTLISRIINAESNMQIASFESILGVTVPPAAIGSPTTGYVEVPLIPEDFIKPVLAVPTAQRTTYVARVNTAPQVDRDVDAEGRVIEAGPAKDVIDTPSVMVEPSEAGWKLFGMAWYWWGGIVGLLAGAGWLGRNWYQNRLEV